MADNTAGESADTGAAAPAGTEAPQAESLLDTAAKPQEGAAPAPEAAKPGDKPAAETLLAGKYKTPADLEKAYKSLETKLGETSSKLKGFKGAPEKYELTVPEDLAGQLEWSADDPLLAGFQEKAKAWGMSQEAFTEAIHMLAQYEFTNASGDLKAEKERLGENADQRLTDFSNWLASNLEDERGDVVRAALKPNARLSDVFTAMETLMGLTRQPSAKVGDDVAPSLTLADVDRMQADPRFATDPTYRAEVRAKRAQVVGNGQHIQVMGKR